LQELISFRFRKHGFAFAVTRALKKALIFVLLGKLGELATPFSEDFDVEEVASTYEDFFHEYEKQKRHHAQAQTTSWNPNMAWRQNKTMSS